MDFTFGGEERRHFRETIEPLRDDDGKIVGVIGAATDITEQQRTQQQLTDELDFRERMMGILGHDLRNPLGTIVMASDLLLRRPDLPAAVRDHAAAHPPRRRPDAGDDRHAAGLHARAIHGQGSGDACAGATWPRLRSGALDEMRARLAGPRDRPAGARRLGGEWDPARMSQTITNLVGNAIAYGERGTPVRDRDRGRRTRRWS